MSEPVPGATPEPKAKPASGGSTQDSNGGGSSKFKVQSSKEVPSTKAQLVPTGFAPKRG